MTTLVLVVAAVLVGVALVLLREVRSRNLSDWVWTWVRRRLQTRYVPPVGQTVDVMFCFVDHFEPLAGPTKAAERERMRSWVEDYPKLADAHRDSDGVPAQHTWFYPGEAYDEECLEGLRELAAGGYGEIELHLHHAFDIPERLRAKLETAVRSFARHGALTTTEDPPRQTYGFIHGNMGLNNALGPGKCGVNEELLVLKDTGCYADFSLPTAPAKSQARLINCVYYASNVPGRPKSHEHGVEVEVGRKPSGDLLIVQGPLALDFRRRKYGLLPTLENGEVHVNNAPTPAKVRLWVSQHIHVKGRPEWIYVKVSCHGAEDHNHEVLLGRTADAMYATLEKEYRDRPGFRLHYVTARELFNIIKAAEAGESGDPHRYRDYVIPRYRTHVEAPARGRAATTAVTT
ncbi:MAG TPA: hypothetical protein VGL09_12820 [Methylomirabilota bacterium]|jgi:hypothetical protein